MLNFHIDIVCDGLGCSQPFVSAQPTLTRFTGSSWSECYVKARKHGWTLSLKYALCPCCAGKRQQEQQVLVMESGAHRPRCGTSIEKRRLS